MVLSGAFMISFSAVWANVAEVPAITSAFYRVFFGFTFLLPAALHSGEFQQFPYKQILLMVLCGVTFALDLFFWHTSILYVGPGLATILGNFQVFVMAACGVIFFGEKLKMRYILALPIAISGLFLVIGIDWVNLSSNYKMGILYGLITALCYACFLLLLKKLQEKDTAKVRFLPLTCISCLSAISLAAVMVTRDISFAIPTVTSGLALLCLGLFSQAVGWMLIANGLPPIRASLTGLILLLQPSLSFIWDVLFFSRPTSSLHWLGVSITLIAIYMGLTGSTREQDR